MDGDTDADIKDRHIAEEWRYLGRRELQRGGLGALYQLPDGQTALFASKRPPSVVGRNYEVAVIRNQDDLAISGRPRFLAVPDAQDPSVARLEAEDRAALTADRLRKAEAKAKRQSPERFGALTLAEPRELYLRSAAIHGAALLGQVLRYIGAA